MKQQSTKHNAMYPLTTKRTVKVPVQVVTVTVSTEIVEREYVLRPWKVSEIPFGAKFRNWNKTERNQTIIGFDAKYSCIKSPAILLSNPKFQGHDDHYFINDLVTSKSEPEWSFDGITWERCGVWVPVAPIE